jgi:hypothetical protein
MSTADRAKTASVLIAAIAAAVSIVGAWFSVHNAELAMEQSAEQVMGDRNPYVDLAYAKVVTTPTDSDVPIVQLVLTNKGATPAKNVVVNARVELRDPGVSLCPPKLKDFAKHGSTYAVDSEQIVLTRGDALNGDLRKQYRSGIKRLYVWGRVTYWDYWKNPERQRTELVQFYPRSAIFCRSYGTDEEDIKRLSGEAGKDVTTFMVPCTADEWRFDDVQGDQLAKYEACVEIDPRPQP